jgi:ABC-2 type transport system ATP-binding protein
LDEGEKNMDRQPILEIKNISKSIAKQKVIDQVSFDVYPGEVFGLLGPNGAGKTTLIRLIVGLMKLDQGDVFIDGYSVRTQFQKAIRPVGAIVERPKWYPFLTGYQNLRLFARMMPDVEKERIDEVIAFLDLGDSVHDPVHTFSPGMQQRLGLAQAILSKPRLLILDEPVNGLDPIGIRRLRDLLGKLAREQKTAVLISGHLLSEMQRMCDRFAVMNAGKCVAVRSLKREPDKEAEAGWVRFEVDSLENVKTALQELNWEKEFVPVPKGFEIMLKKGQIPEFTAELMKQGVKVYGIGVVHQTMEDQYLEMIEGEADGPLEPACT